MIVKENIDFKRTGNSKEALKIGPREINKDWHNFRRNMEEAFNPFGIKINSILTTHNKPAVIVFKISDDDYKRSFNNNPVDLDKFLKEWIESNTYLMFERVRVLKGTDSYAFDVYAPY